MLLMLFELLVVMKLNSALDFLFILDIDVFLDSF